MSKNIKAFHTSWIMQQCFIIYEDNTMTMFPVLFKENKPDEFFPNICEFNKILDSIFKKL
jgi:hypothetical protein